jgi:hypothetical protein
MSKIVWHEISANRSVAAVKRKIALVGFLFSGIKHVLGEQKRLLPKAIIINAKNVSTDPV